MRPFRFAVLQIMAISLTLFAAIPAAVIAQPLEAIIPVLGVSTGPERRGMITYASIIVDSAQTSATLEVEFGDGPGQFSDDAKAAVMTAIQRAAIQLGVTLSRFRVVVRALDPNTIIYGHSLSAIMALATVALVHGYIPTSNCAVTGTIEADGRIGPVGSIREKIAAAADAHYSRVLVPDQATTYEPEWRTPFLMQISPVRTVAEAYTEFIKPLFHRLATAPVTVEATSEPQVVADPGPLRSDPSPTVEPLTR